MLQKQEKKIMITIFFVPSKNNWKRVNFIYGSDNSINPPLKRFVCLNFRATEKGKDTDRSSIH